MTSLSNLLIFISVMFAFVFVSVTFFFPAFPTLETDKITRLPNQPKVNFDQYSGYIPVDENNNRRLFYYFVEAENEPASKPVVIWLHGGPGCSAVGGGAFGQHGPFKVTIRGLVKNPYSWNKVANMLYLDSPAGTGFSYSTNTSDYMLVTDEMAARDHLVFLQHWFNKFSNFKTNEFFIAGESYAGHFAPQLAQLILETKSDINLKGIAIGNPLLEFDTDYNSTVDFSWGHGQIEDLIYWKLKNICGYASIRREFITKKYTKACNDVNIELNTNVNRSINTFNVYTRTCPAESENEEYLQQTEKKANFVCIRDATNVYMRKKETVKALHALLVGIQKWSICSEILLYNPYEQLNPTITLLGTLVRSGVRILVFSGDTDSVIPFIGTRTLIQKMAEDFGYKTSRNYEAWFQGGQVAGWTQVFEDILTFATIKRGGHSAGVSQPKRSLVMLKAFLDRKPLPKRHPFPSIKNRYYD